MHTLLNYRVLGTSTALFSFKWSFSLCTYIYLGWMPCLISFVWHQFTCQVESDKMYNKKNLAHSGIRTYSPEIWSLMLYQLSGLRWKLYYFNDLYTYIYFRYLLYIGISSRMMKWSVFCLVNVLFLLHIVYCANSKMTCKSCVCFQHAKHDQTFYVI